MRKKQKRTERGITLIALVVTIVVLLILAGVTIAMLRGENGILSKAESAKEATENKGAEEKVGLAISAARAKGLGTLTIANLREEVENNYGGTVTGEEFPVTVTIDGKAFSVTTDGGVTSTKETSIDIGSYVQYDMPYTDMYSGQEYTATNGWRYLGKDDSGNQLIVSTGIPAILFYSSATNKGNQANGGANSWWATKNEISSTTDTLYKTTKGYDYNTDSGEPNKYAAYGMRYKFGRIPFSYQASGTRVSTANTGIFRKIGNTTSGTNINLNFRANGTDVVDVHNLTLAELNRATSKASGTTREDIDTTSGFKDLTGTALGLFDMQKLDGYTQNYYYWLASPSTSSRNDVYGVNYISSDVRLYSNSSNGLRPVVTLKPDVQLTVVD